MTENNFSNVASADRYIIRALVAVALLCPAAHAADPAVGCYQITTTPHVNFFAHEALALIDKPTANHDRYLSNSKEISFYEDHHMHPLAGYWHRDSDEVMVVLSDNSREGYSAKVKKIDTGLSGKLRGFGRLMLKEGTGPDTFSEYEADITLTRSSCQ